LVETLVAISIFTLSILALVVIMGDSVAHVNYAKRKLVATTLAQEGVEYMRNLRDTYVLYAPQGEDGWVDFLDSVWPSCNDQETKGCYFDINDLNYSEPNGPIIDAGVSQCVSGGSLTPCPYIYYHPDTGAYDYNTAGGINSGLRRVILIKGNDTELTNQDEIRVTSIVYWTQGSGDYYISFSANLFNWTK
jgi:type II secretory pathway pseudopilin PulG